MTDNEIIKALDCCCVSECDACPYDEQTACVEMVKEGALALINRQKATIKEFDEKIIMQLGLIKHQKAEIKRLSKVDALPKQGFCNLLCGALVYTTTLEEYNVFRKSIRAEIIKEFAERLKYSLTEYPDCYFKEPITSTQIDNLVKEMTEQ